MITALCSFARMINVNVMDTHLFFLYLNTVCDYESTDLSTIKFRVVLFYCIPPLFVLEAVSGVERHLAHSYPVFCWCLMSAPIQVIMSASIHQDYLWSTVASSWQVHGHLILKSFGLSKSCLQSYLPAWCCVLETMKLPSVKSTVTSLGHCCSDA